MKVELTKAQLEMLNTILLQTQYPGASVKSVVKLMEALNGKL